MTLTAAIAAFVNAALALVTNFGVNLTDNQKGSITLLVNAGLVLGALVYDRRKGIPPVQLPKPNGTP